MTWLVPKDKHPKNWVLIRLINDVPQSLLVTTLLLLKVKNWVRELRRMLGDDICLVIAGNKTDLERERHVSLEEAEA